MPTTRMRLNKILPQLWLPVFVLTWSFMQPGADARAQHPSTSEDHYVTAKPVQYIVYLKGTRETWPDDMTADEEEIMGKHFVYLQNLMYEGKMLLAGPSQGLKVGLVVLNVADEAEARRIMDVEPSVAGGVHTYELYPFVASLLYGRDRLPATETDRRVVKEVVVDAPRDSVWNVWTTAEGITSFFSPEANVELRVGGRFEMLFNPDKSMAGSRGGEGCRILSYLPKELLTFSWNAPPQYADARRYRTRVVLQFSDAPQGKTRVKLTHLGWGPEPMWNDVYDYFDSAWGRVMENLQKRFSSDG